MKIDLYTKITLTLIAIALWGLLLQPLIISRPVVASTGITDVNIKQIDGKNIKPTIDVNIKEISGRKFYNPSLPVMMNNLD
ncbi:MAG: hypothetical protein DHS20C13_23310 [Thermodesulfobacteriota bacterium]|nr:MAG: hypothetical protein DHS20C13_23310 [Thermodesulfobacteriota bacterium]